MSGQNSRVVSSLWWYLQELQPLVLMFDLMIATGEGSHMAVVHRVQQSYAVTVTIRPHRHRISSSSHSSSRDACVVIVRGSVANSKAVKEATSVLFEQLTGGIEVVTMMFFSFIVTCKPIAKKFIKPPILALKVIQGHWIRRQSRASLRLPIND